MSLNVQFDPIGRELQYSTDIFLNMHSDVFKFLIKSTLDFTSVDMSRENIIFSYEMKLPMHIVVIRGSGWLMSMIFKNTVISSSRLTISENCRKMYYIWIFP
jgi:hypothetical protein